MMVLPSCLEVGIWSIRFVFQASAPMLRLRLRLLALFYWECQREESFVISLLLGSVMLLDDVSAEVTLLSLEGLVSKVLLMSSCDYFCSDCSSEVSCWLFLLIYSRGE